MTRSNELTDTPESDDINATTDTSAMRFQTELDIATHEDSAQTSLHAPRAGLSSGLSLSHSTSRSSEGSSIGSCVGSCVGSWVITEAQLRAAAKVLECQLRRATAQVENR